jgi:predicted O-linked N-acetylglucosamine transferase (SPINDLY family)
VLCAFHRHEKIDPASFAAWLRVLKAVPGGVLWLLEGPGQANLRQHAASAGVDAGRLVFAPRRDTAAHMARLRLADLFLDAFNYNAHTLGGEALWAGVPLVTCPGRHWVSRVGASLLRAAGLADLEARNVAEYEALAIRLATDPAELAAVRAQLERARATCPLFDIERQVRNLDLAYLEMWRLHQAGEAPRSFSVKEP